MIINSIGGDFRGVLKEKVCWYWTQ